MTKIQGYLWRAQETWQRNNLNVCINPNQQALLSTLLLPPNQPTQVHLTFCTLPVGNPRHFDDENTKEAIAGIEPIQNLLLIITDQVDGFLRCNIQPNQVQCVISQYLLLTFIDHIQECQDNAYCGEVSMPLFQGEREGQLVFWTWHKKEAIFV